MEGRQRMRRWGAALAAVSLCLVLLTGCGQGGPVETAEDAGTQREATDGQAGGTSQTDTVGEDDATSGAAPEQEETPGTPVDALPDDFLYRTFLPRWRFWVSLAAIVLLLLLCLPALVAA